MQKEVTTTVTVDDLDGETPAETRAFVLDGTTHHIDLNEAHIRELGEALNAYGDALTALDHAKQALERFTSVAVAQERAPEQPSGQPSGHDEVAEKRTRKRTSKKPAKKVAAARKQTAKTKAPTQPTAAEIRRWAHENDVPVSKTGRVGKDARQAYLEAHAA